MTMLSNQPTVIAEIGGNHGGDLELAKQMVVAAVEAGTPYVKFQTYIAERLLGREHPAFDTFVEEALSFDDFRELSGFCKEVGAVFLSTPFDPESADLLEELDVPAFKIASGDLNYLPLLTHIAQKHRPILLSTGSSMFEDVGRAVRTIREVSDSELVLLHCTSAYPCPEHEANLSVISKLSEYFHCPVGFSDHTLGVENALAAVALGAVVLEKHFTTDKTLPGGDNDISLLPEELDFLCKGVKKVFRSMGSSFRQRTATEESRNIRLHRSLVARRDLKVNEVLELGDLDAVRPGDGISPADVESVVGRTLVTDVDRGQKILPEHFS